MATSFHRFVEVHDIYPQHPDKSLSMLGRASVCSGQRPVKTPAAVIPAGKADTLAMTLGTAEASTLLRTKLVSRPSPITTTNATTAAR